MGGGGKRLMGEGCALATISTAPLSEFSGSAPDTNDVLAVYLVKPINASRILTSELRKITEIRNVFSFWFQVTSDKRGQSGEYLNLLAVNCCSNA